jgi:hypothetical protein
MKIPLRNSRFSPPAPARQALLLGLVLASQPLGADTTTVWTLDLNHDGLTDVSRIRVSVVVFVPFPMGGGIYENHVNDSLLVTGGGALLDVLAPLTTNDVLSLNPGTGAHWEPSLLLYTTDGYPVFTNLPYVAVRFPAGDGTHLGWLKLSSAWDLSDFGWQPEPDAPIRVGDKPSAPGTEDESVRLIPADLDNGGIDFVLRVRAWTNRVSGIRGVSAVLTNRLGFEVLSLPGRVDGQPVWFPWPAREGLPIPTQPPAAASWQAPEGGVVLFEERRDAQEGVMMRTGPLADRGELVIGVRRRDAPDRLVGWLRYSDKFTFLGQDLRGPSYCVGEPATLEREVTRERWDLNGDGPIEFVIVSCEDSMWSWVLGDTVENRWSTLFPLRQARLLSGAGLAPGTPISLAPVGSGQWVTNSVDLWFVATAFASGQVLGSNVFAGVLGLYFTMEDGIHLAWTRPEDGTSAFEPRPGVPLPAGVAPTSVGAAVEDGELVLYWNPSLSDHVLEATPSMPAPDWQSVNGQTPGRTVVPLAGDSRFFRLAAPHP